jgi:hypothetical protein
MPEAAQTRPLPFTAIQGKVRHKCSDRFLPDILVWSVLPSERRRLLIFTSFE